MFGFSAMCIMACVMGFPIMWLWNYTMPFIFGLPEIDFFHALTLNILCGALFGRNSYSRPTKKKKVNDINGKDQE